MTASESPHSRKILEYRARALEAAEEAVRAKDPDVRKSWELIASGYHDMAERLARLQRQ
ncbi:MAG: hypothetical protein JO256_00410 [Alphaproteobacteria bacterium]|nr:hypothetical protein [Alphaproteobacteria bacterium]